MLFVGLVDTVSAKNGSDYNDYNRESDWYNEDEWVLLLIKMDHLWVGLNDNSLILLNWLIFPLNSNSHIVVSNLLINLDSKIWVKVVSFANIVLNVLSVDDGSWLVIGSTAATCISSGNSCCEFQNRSTKVDSTISKSLILSLLEFIKCLAFLWFNFIIDNKRALINTNNLDLRCVDS